MNITDLSYINVVTEDTDIMGGRRKRRRKPGTARAEGSVDAVAVGRNTRTDAIVELDAVAGKGSSTYVYGVASARGR
ncbi:MAG: hypothetical protein AAF959_22860 [Cyanobacteria bacterium P01_D01_bin.56]